MNSFFSSAIPRKYGLVVRLFITFCFLTSILLPNQPTKAKTQLAENAGSELSYAVADSFRFPLNGQWKVMLDFGAYNSDSRFAGRKHLGEDVSAAPETPLYAIANGEVKENYLRTSYMHVVIIEHTLSDGSKVTSVYGHMKADGIIPVGTEVTKGQLIGYLDTLASFQDNSYAPHEHFGIRKGAYSSTWVYYGYETGSETIANWYDPSDFINSHQGGSGLCSAPTNGIPRDGNTLNSQQVSFSWSPSSCEGIDYYTFRVASHSDIDNGPWIIDHGVSKDAVSTVENIPSSYNGQTLYWAIWPHNSAGYGTRGGPWAFKIDTSTPPPPPPLPTGDWNVQYFRNKELTDQCSSSSFNRTFIFSDWGEGAPASGCNTDNWGARFTRRVNFQGGNYTFALEADDWGRIYVDGNLFVDKWNGASQHYEGHYVSPGDHDVKIEFADTMGGAKISAWWWGPGFNIPHDDQDNNQWYANYWINQDQWWDSFAKVNEGTGQLFHQWDYSSPGWDMPDDHFSASFQRQAYFECGTYRFNIDHDDGAKFTLDSDLKIDRWTGNIGAYSIDLPVSQGIHSLKIDYYENGGAAHISFNWQKLNGCAPSIPVITAPGNNQTLDWNSDITFRWNSSTGATRYFVNLQGGPGVNQDSGWLNTNEWYFGALWPGDYTWTVTAANDSGSSPAASASFSVNEPPPQPPVADFTAEPLSGSAPLSVTFTNLSTGDISSCSWTYGDGQTGSSCNDTNTHTYNSGGTYTVSLTVSGPAGSHSATRTDYITVNASIPNDEINQAFQVVTLPYSNLQSITGATTASDDPPLPCIGNQKYKTVWYRFTAPSNGVLTVDTFDSDYDTVLALWTGQRGSLIQVPNGCNDDSQLNSQSEVMVQVTANTIYYIEIASYFDISDGQLVLHVEGDTTSPNLSWIAPVQDTQAYDVYGQTLSLEVDASDSSGINRVEFYRWDYVNLVSVPIGTVTTLPYRINFDTGSLLPEWNEIDAWAYDNAGNSANKYIWLNKIDTAFSKTDPSNASTDNATNLTLSWGVSSGATGYEYCYDTTNDNTCANWTSAGTNTAAGLSGLSNGTTYYWQVRAINTGGFTYANGSANSFWSFTIGNLPGSFAKATPANTASGVITNPVLSWGVSNGATSYEYCYDTSNDNACSTWTSNSTSTSVTLDGLSQNTTYYWHVRARNGFGTTYANGTATAFWSFTTGGQPGAFNKSTPSNGSTGNSTSQTLTWGTSAGATSYEYCYDTTNDNTCSSWISNGTATSKALSGLSNNTTYYWHVRAVNSIGTMYANGSTINFWSFTTGSQPAGFNKSGPANGSTGVSISPTLSWGNSSGVVSFEYCYDTTNDSSCNNWTGNGTNTSITLSGLSTNTTYYWHVRAVNTFGTTYANGSATAFWTFSTGTGNQPGAFGKTAPTNGSANVSINPTIGWESSTGATSYEYCYDTSNDNACANWTSNGANTSIILSGLALNTTYYWHVRANNTFGTTFSNGTNTGFWSFTTGNIPGVFAKMSPTNGATSVSTSPTINWSTSNGATNYEYCYDTTNDNACTTWKGNGSNTSVTLSGLSTNTPYYWHVRAGNTFGTTYANGTATSFWSFTTVPNPGGAVLALNPQTSSIAMGQNFSVTVEVRAGTQQVDGACAYLDFNSTYFSAVSITPGTTLGNVLVNNYDSAGQVNYCAGALSNFPSGTFTLASVTFRANAVITSTPLEFNLTSPRKSDVTYGGNSVLGSTFNGTVEISNTATLNGSVTLQGRPNVPHTRWAVPLTVTLNVPGNGQLAYTFTPTTDTSGRFSLSGITPGTYDVRVKHIHTLRNVKRVTLVNGENNVDMGVLLEGDARNDNDVSLTDFSVLASTYGKCQGVTGYDERSDFNGDTCIDLLDFSWLATNFGKTGDNHVTNSTSAEELENLLVPVSIVVDPHDSDVMVGDTFTIAIKVEAGSQLVDGAQASLDFDPIKLRVKSIQGNQTAFPNTLLNTYNNTTGTIDYAAGALSNFPNGTITLVSIEFEALEQSPATPITFHYGQPPRNTNVTYGGSSVLTGDQDGQVKSEFKYKLFLPAVRR